MSKSKQTPGTHVSAQSTPGTGPDITAGNWPILSEEALAMWFGTPWLTMWARTWTTWMQQLSALTALPTGDADRDDERRLRGLPWLPYVETTVVPLRRSSDPPGAEAAKVSLRLRVPSSPWTPSETNVISFDALMPRSAATGGAEGLIAEQVVETGTRH